MGLQDWLMNCVLSKTMLLLKRRASAHLRAKSMKWRTGLLRPMRQLPRVAEMPWPSWSLAFVKWRLSLEVFKARPRMLTRPSRSLRGASRSCSSSRMRTTRAKIKTYKKQIEEAEEIAALNLAKFRKAQQELEE